MVAAATPDVLVTTYLEMTSPDEFKSSMVNDPAVRITRLSRADIYYYRFLYNEVGKDWRWRDRMLISEKELKTALSKPGVAVYVMHVNDLPAGYVELCRQGNETEIAYFGLRDRFMGRGLGKYLLSYGIDQAWRAGAKRVWLHTCNLDSPYALENYMKRGFRIYHTEKEEMPNRYV